MRNMSLCAAAYIVKVGLCWGKVWTLGCSQAMCSHHRLQSSRCSVMTAYLMRKTCLIIFLFCFFSRHQELLPGTISIPHDATPVVAALTSNDIAKLDIGG